MDQLLFTLVQVALFIGAIIGFYRLFVWAYERWENRRRP